jgi:hypothetical protein
VAAGLRVGAQPVTRKQQPAAQLEHVCAR